jgi:hypothetical protein
MDRRSLNIDLIPYYLWKSSSVTAEVGAAAVERHRKMTGPVKKIKNKH